MPKKLSHIFNLSGVTSASGTFPSASKTDNGDLGKGLNNVLEGFAKKVEEFEHERLIDLIIGFSNASPMDALPPASFFTNAMLGWPKTLFDVNLAIENHIIDDAKRRKFLLDGMDEESREDLFRTNPDIATPLLQRRDRQLMEAVWHLTHSCGDPEDPLKATATIGDCLKAILQTAAEYVEPESPEDLRRAKTNEFVARRWFRIGPTMEGC
jgi:hypothetical protein